MEKIKQVFSGHSDNHTSTTGSHTGSTGHHSTTGSTTAPPTRSSAGDRTAGDVVEPSASRAATASTTDSVSRTNPGGDTGLTSGSTGTTTLTTGTSATTGATHGTHGTHHGTDGSHHGLTGEKTHLKEVANPPPHQHQHHREDALLDVNDAKAATHDHQHLAPVTHERHQVHEVEEVERQREVDRHVHHVQHHVQPVLDTQHGTEHVEKKVVPTTEIKEQHVATDEDKAQFASLGTARDQFAEGPRERTIVDKGENVVEHDHHHVHHVVQPVIERDVHEHNRIKTTIPVHQETHEAPIVHQSVQHEPLKLDQFVAGGGDLKSNLKHDANLLDRGQCERTVDGPAESMTETLGLSQPSATSGTSSRV
ncbi:hypothetical protein JCM3774_005234 [Rhodotorula dairenensis]